MKLIPYIFFVFVLFCLTISRVNASPSFTVTSFEDEHNFLWVGGPSSGCSADNSYVMTYPGNGQQSHLFSCGETFGSSDNPVSDGTYYVMLTVGGQIWKSQVFSIVDGHFSAPTPTATPTLTPTPINHPPVAVAGTSLNEKGNLLLDGTLSSDLDNDPLTYTWQINNNTSIRTGRTVAISDLSPGTHSIVLTVSDGLLQSIDTIKVGTVTKRSNPTLTMKIESAEINKKKGTFTIKGEFDEKNPLFATILSQPKARILFELQTGGTHIAPVYGVVGESTINLSSSGKEYKY